MFAHFLAKCEFVSVLLPTYPGADCLLHQVPGRCHQIEPGNSSSSEKCSVSKVGSKKKSNIHLKSRLLLILASSSCLSLWRAPSLHRLTSLLRVSRQGWNSSRPPAWLMIAAVRRGSRVILCIGSIRKEWRERDWQAWSCQR